MCSLLIVFMAISMLMMPCGSQYEQQYEQEYHEMFAFMYGDGIKSNKRHNLINVTGLSLSIANNELYVVFCDQTKKRYSIKQNIVQYLNIDFDKKNQFQLIINQHAICRKICNQNNLKLNEMSIFNKPESTETVQIWSIDKQNIQRHLLELSVNDSADTFESTFDETLDHDTNTPQHPSYEWWEFWKSEWWNDWNISKIITASVILIVVIGFIVFIIGCCTYYSCKRHKRRYERNKNNKSNDNNIESERTSIDKNNHYNKIQQDTDLDTDHEDVFITMVATESNGAKPEEIKLNEIKSNEKNDDIKRSDIELQKTENHKKNINENKNENKNKNESESENDSESDSEALFGPGNADNGDIAFVTAAGAMTYTMGTPGNEQQADQQTLRSDSTATFMDKASIKSSMKAAEMTVGAPQNKKEKINQQEEENKAPEIQQNNGYKTKSNQGNEEGFDWDIWLKNTLKRCFPNDWAKYLSHFRKQRITEDVLMSLTIDKHNKGEIWKELIPVIGDRVRFQKSWENELMRRQLNKKI